MRSLASSVVLGQTPPGLSGFEPATGINGAAIKAARRSAAAPRKKRLPRSITIRNPSDDDNTSGTSF
jgi:hypothetical protein